MTMPIERTRALIYAYEYLIERQNASGLTIEEKREIATILRHYPTPREIRFEATRLERKRPD